MPSLAQLPTGVDIPAAPAPVDYAGYGRTVGNAITQGGQQIGNILKGFQEVERMGNKEKLKEGILAELRVKAPHVLKFMKPDPTFEEVAQGAYQMAMVEGLHKQLVESIPVDPATGKPDYSIAPIETAQQLAFAAPEDTFDKMVAKYNTFLGEADQARKNREISSANQAGAAAGGSRETNIKAALADPGAARMDPRQSQDLLEKSGVSEKDAQAMQTKKDIEEIKAAGRVASAEKMAAAKARATASQERHRTAMEKSSTLDNVNDVTNILDNKRTDILAEAKAKSTAEDRVIKASAEVKSYKALAEKFKQRYEDDGADDVEKNAARAKYNAALDSYNASVGEVSTLNALVDYHDAQIEQHKQRELEYKAAVLKAMPGAKNYFDTWEREIDGAVGGSGAGSSGSPAPANVAPVTGNGTTPRFKRHTAKL